MAAKSAGKPAKSAPKKAAPTVPPGTGDKKPYPPKKKK